jgi:SAM-dependent methyltransferase
MLTQDRDGVVSEETEPVHERIADLVAGVLGGRVLDLGCGRGPTLRALSQRAPRSTLVGVDRAAEALRDLPKAVAGHAGPVLGIEADLRADLPFADGSMDVVVSYNTLECVPDPARLLSEVHRVLRPGGRVVIAHMDFDSMVLAGADRTLDRRACHGFADYEQGWMDHADGRMGRDIAGLVAASPLRPVAVEPLLVWSAQLEGHAAQRIEDMRKALHSAWRHQKSDLAPAEVEKWFDSLCEADDAGGFFFSELAFLVVAEREAVAVNGAVDAAGPLGAKAA